VLLPLDDATVGDGLEVVVDGVEDGELDDAALLLDVADVVPVLFDADDDNGTVSEGLTVEVDAVEGGVLDDTVAAVVLDVTVEAPEVTVFTTAELPAVVALAAPPPVDAAFVVAASLLTAALGAVVGTTAEEVEAVDDCGEDVDVAAELVDPVVLA
jgi:hypothetical protein